MSILEATQIPPPNTEVHPPEPGAQPELEHPPLSPGEQQFLDELVFLAEEDQQNKMQLDEFMRQKIDAIPDPADRKAAETVAEGIKWRWFAMPGEPMPEGVAGVNDTFSVVFTDDDVQAKSRAMDDYLLTGSGIFHARSTRLFSDTNRQEHAQTLKDALTTIVRENPTYAYLQALVSEAPQATEAPLNEMQRRTREAQEEASIRKTHNVPRNHDLRQHPHAHRTLQRRISQLDDETAPRQQQSEVLNPMHKIYTLVFDYINQQPARQKDGLVVTRMEAAENSKVRYLTADGQEVHDVSFPVRNRWGENHGKELTYYEANDASDIRRLALQLQREVLNPTGRTARELIDDAFTVWHLREDFILNDAGVLRNYLAGYNVPLFTDEANFTDSRAPRHWDKPEVPLVPSVISAEEIEKEKHEIIASIGADGKRQAGRLIVTTNGLSRYPEPDGSAYDLSLTPEEGNDTFNTQVNRVPYVPGYELVAFDTKNNRWLFTEAAEDPYQEASGIHISPENQQRVTTALQELGLNKLAEKIAQTPDLDVAKLVKQIQNFSDYTFDTHRQALPFTKFIDDHGRLQVQCSGAGLFLQHILKFALPEASAHTITGYRIDEKTGSFVTAARHAQVLLRTKEGESYILDSTPSRNQSGARSSQSKRWAQRRSPEERKHRANMRAVVRRSRRQHKQDQKRSRRQPIKEQTRTEHTPIKAGSTLSERTAEQREARAQTVVNRTKSLLKAHFDLKANSPDEMLYKRVSELKKDADPARRVLELAMRSDNKSHAPTQAELAAAKRYIKNMRTAKPDTFKRVGIPKYDDTFLDALSGAIDDLMVKVQS